MSLLVGELYAHLLLDKKQFSTSLKAAEAEARTAGAGIGGQLASAGKVAAVGLGVAAAAIAVIGVKATDMAIDFEAAMANVHTLIGSGSESDRRIHELGDAVKEVSLQ